MASRPELKIVEETPDFITAILDGDDNLALHYSRGDASVFTKNPQGPRIIEYMASIAPHFGGVVTGDEGEIFSSASDWGTQSDWDRPTPKKTFWQREFTTGNIIRMAVLLLVAATLIYKHLIARH